MVSRNKERSALLDMMRDAIRGRYDTSAFRAAIKTLCETHGLSYDALAHEATSNA